MASVPSHLSSNSQATSRSKDQPEHGCSSAVSQWEHSADEWVCQEGKKGGLGTVGFMGQRQGGEHQGVTEGHRGGKRAAWETFPCSVSGGLLVRLMWSGGCRKLRCGQQ